jgi:tetratricopeptide (TPR) repeat protein
MKLNLLVAAFAACLLLPASSAAQNGPQNLEFYPTSMTRGEIIAEMRHFTFALGVRCEHCHERNENGRGFDFASDANPNKEKARVMLFMTDAINSQFLPDLADRDNPPVEVTCKTCHRGTQLPRLLWQEMVLTTHEEGAEAAIEQFNQLREDYDNAGAYDFREQEMNVVGEELAAEGHHEDAIIIFELNAERYPDSPLPWAGIGESHEALGNIDEAIAAYEKALEINPNQGSLVRKLEELKGG